LLRKKNDKMWRPRPSPARRELAARRSVARRRELRCSVGGAAVGGEDGVGGMAVGSGEEGGGGATGGNHLDVVGLNISY
jgi:hypothetical protein